MQAATNTNYPDEIFSAGQLLKILDSDVSEVSTLCRRACLKPKKDGSGNIYFSKSDVDVLKKIKELYERTKRLQEERKSMGENSNIKKDAIRISDTKKAEPEIKRELPSLNILNNEASQMQIFGKLENVSDTIVNKITDVINEKLDGLDEVIVELIKAKTENENLRQKVNQLNKENFALKSENASYKSVGLGLYIKKSTDDFTF